MSLESAKACLERMKADEEFRNRVIAAKLKEARMRLIRTHGFDFDETELEELQEQLADEELDGLAACLLVDEKTP